MTLNSQQNALPLELRKRVTSQDCPLVSVVILYYKRRETIEETIRSVLDQDYRNREIIVVDNHSQDGVCERLQSYSPELRFVELPRNLGACGGRNAGIREASGEIIVVLDDDVSFPSKSELTEVVETFKCHPDAHVLAFRVCEPGTMKVRTREWCHPRPCADFSELEFETSWFGEGASALRRQVFDVCGLFYEPLFYGAEGHDLIVRILDHGFRILYTPSIRVCHREAREGRTADRQYYFFTRNYCWIAYKDYRFAAGIVFLAQKLLMMFYFAIRTATYAAFFRGLWHGLVGLRHIRHDRTPISESTSRYLAEMDKLRPTLMVRLARHRTAPQL
jgi:GT2 family glycosyltransferase